MLKTTLVPLGDSIYVCAICGRRQIMLESARKGPRGCSRGCQYVRVKLPHGREMVVGVRGISPDPAPVDYRNRLKRDLDIMVDRYLPRPEVRRTVTKLGLIAGEL